MSVKRWRLIHDPTTDGADTGLRFTDILFGFVIKELFTRFGDWSALSGTALCHLVAGTVLVLGSYIGYRKSLHRGNFRLAFFNLPLLRFLVDQAMVASYFWFVNVTPVLSDGQREMPSDAEIVRTDLNFLIWIFLLYVVWDVLSWVMIKWNYEVKNGPEKVVKYDRLRLMMSIVPLILFGFARAFVVGSFSPLVVQLGIILVLLAYRVAKDARIY